MKKSRKTPKKKSVGRAFLIGGVSLALVGAGVGIASMGGNTQGEVIVNVESDSTLKAPLEVTSSDIEAGTSLTQEVYLISQSGKTFSFNTSEEYSDTLIAGNKYTAFLLDTDGYGSNLVISDNDMSGAVRTANGGVEFVLGDEGTDLKVEVNAISDYSLKAEDEINGGELFVNGSDAYQTADTLVFANETGGIIDVVDSFESTVFVKPNTVDAVANDNGMLIVVDTDADEWEDLAVTFNGKALTELSRDDLKEMFAEVNYNNFRTKHVFMVDKDVVLERNSEYEMVIASTLVDGASVTDDIVAEMYTLGYIKTAGGRELSALNEDGSAIHGDVDKSITFNLA